MKLTEEDVKNMTLKEMMELLAKKMEEGKKVMAELRKQMEEDHLIQ